MRHSIDEIVDQYKNSILKMCYGYSNTIYDAEDLAQEVLINIWKGLESFNNQSNIKTWIYRITVNTCSLKLRKKRIKTISMDAFDNPFISVQNEVNDNENLQKLYESIQHLKEDEKILILLYLEGLSHKEIASVIGIKANYVGVKINRIKNNLSTKINNNG